MVQVFYSKKTREKLGIGGSQKFIIFKSLRRVVEVSEAGLDKPCSQSIASETTAVV